MKEILRKIGDIMVAITFAEAGELETAKEFLNEGPEPREGELEPTFDAV